MASAPLTAEQRRASRAGALVVLRRALSRLWGRDVMLYTGGVSFFALLAIFPALALMVSIYGLLLTPSQAEGQAEVLAELLPPDAQGLFADELGRFITASHQAVSLQSLFALLVGVYAAHRGIKALLAGLSFIHEEDKPLSFMRFNVMALVVGVGAFLLGAALSVAFLVLRLVTAAIHLPIGDTWFGNGWLGSFLGLTLGLGLLYRYAMSTAPVGWRASGAGGMFAAALVIAASKICAVYVAQVAHLGATYGSVGAVIVFLVWLSWNVNAIFFGGALATEIEIALIGGVRLPVISRIPPGRHSVDRPPVDAAARR